MAPNRTQLQILVQKPDESFKEYAQYWRDLVARVQPPLLEKELVGMFMDTLQGPYLDRLTRSTTSGFSNLVIIGERIENGLKIGKIQNTTTAASGAKKYHSGFPKKKEGEANAAMIAKREDGAYQIPYYSVAAVAPNLYQQPMYVIPTGPPPMEYQHPYTPQRQNPYQQGHRKLRKPERRIDPIPMSYSPLLTHLLRDSLVQYIELGPP